MRGVALLAALGLVAGCAVPGRPSAPVAGNPAVRTVSAARGQEFAQRACAGCHAIGRTGRSAMAHAPSFRDLAERRSNADLARTLSDLPTHGHVEMPPVYITGDELKDVAAYIATLRGRPV